MHILIHNITCYLHLGNLYIADSSHQRIRKVTVSTGLITTIAGTASIGYSGDNGPATAATFDHPYGVGVDTSGSTINATVWTQLLTRLSPPR